MACSLPPNRPTSTERRLRGRHNRLTSTAWTLGGRRSRRPSPARKRKHSLSMEKTEARSRTRTDDPFLTMEVLYQLSYPGRACGPSL